jgi:hypothetical protein
MSHGSGGIVGPDATSHGSGGIVGPDATSHGSGGIVGPDATSHGSGGIVGPDATWTPVFAAAETVNRIRTAAQQTMLLTLLMAPCLVSVTDPTTRAETLTSLRADSLILD